ncbi:MAG: LacI family DNA-binding transcriptional regulator [Anaerolineales bacterium]|nr:LacI family DNA-binding transcriptional regulator [Anaerolineales bacterium]
MPLRVTIVDVARRAGVSTATVSRVVNRAGNVHAQTEARACTSWATVKRVIAMHSPIIPRGDAGAAAGRFRRNDCRAVDEGVSARRAEFRRHLRGRR